MIDKKHGVNPQFLRQEELSGGIELLFFAQRDFSHNMDNIRRQYDLGEADQRALFFIHRYDGLTVGDLLQKLGITKQSLHRVLTKLLSRNWVYQQQDPHDKRRKHLYLSESGTEIAKAMLKLQSSILSNAYKQAGADAVEGLWDVLQGLINETDRQALLAKRQSDQSRPQDILKKMRK